MAGPDELSLPQAPEAQISAEKLRDYALNPDHSTGAHKARVFALALGIGGMTGDTCVIRSWPACRSRR